MIGETVEAAAAAAVVRVAAEARAVRLEHLARTWWASLWWVSPQSLCASGSRSALEVRAVWVALGDKEAQEVAVETFVQVRPMVAQEAPVAPVAMAVLVVWAVKAKVACRWEQPVLQAYRYALQTS